MTARSSSTVAAVAVAALAIAFYSGMDAVMKALVLSIGAYNALLWRMLALVALAAAAFGLFSRRRPGPAALRLHAVRGAISALMAFLFFWGLGRVPLAQGIALAFVAPIIALFLAAILLGERIERRSIAAALLGFVGVIVILAGQARAELGPEAFHGALAILASAALYAWNIVLMRQQALAAGPVEIAFFTSLVMGGCFLLLAPFLAALPPTPDLPGILAAAALGFASMMLLAWAYARAEAQHLAPVEYTSFAWAVLLGWLFFAEPVGLATLAGAGLIVAACLIAARRRPAPAAAIEPPV